MKISSPLIKQVALKMTCNAGIPCSLPKSDGEFIANLDKKEIETVKQIVEKSQGFAETDNDAFTPSDEWIVNFAKRWSWLYGQQNEREVNLNALLTNLEPALLFVYTMRRVCGIDVDKGLIMNGDQSMWYRLYQAKKQWIQK